LESSCFAHSYGFSIFHVRFFLAKKKCFEKN